MELIFIVLLILAASVVVVAVKEDNKKNIISSSNTTPKCGCGNTKDPNGYCDGSHNNINNNSTT